MAVSTTAASDLNLREATALQREHFASLMDCRHRQLRPISEAYRRACLAISAGKLSSVVPAFCLHYVRYLQMLQTCHAATDRVEQDARCIR